MKSLVLVVLLSVSSTARANDVDEATWARRYQRSTTVAYGGLITSGAGFGAQVLGISGGAGNNSAGGLNASAGLYLGGMLAWHAGPAIGAAGSLRAAKSLEGMGHVGVSRQPGMIAWGLWGGSMACWMGGFGMIASADPWAVGDEDIDPAVGTGLLLITTGWALNIGAGVSVFAQLARNEDTHRIERRSVQPSAPTSAPGGDGEAPAELAPRRPRLQIIDLAPAWSPEQKGLLLRGVF